MSHTVVITGTSSGFGRSSVARFASEGWNVVATVRKDADLGVHAHLSNVRTLLLDVNDDSADLAFAVEAVQQFGGVDALVNNAGYYHMGPGRGSNAAAGPSAAPDKRVRAHRAEPHAQRSRPRRNGRLMGECTGYQRSGFMSDRLSEHPPSASATSLFSPQYAYSTTQDDGVRL